MKVTYDEFGREVNEPAAEQFGPVVSTPVGNFALASLVSMFTEVHGVVDRAVGEWDNAPADSTEEKEIAETLISDLTEFLSRVERDRVK